ncbi:Uncharacterized conserved protein, tellurite resistance protein B (TerB) family [Sulfitobacter brevis]|uniref:Uncharacterized conserved protein, tellurite resistance protein B (TerB) family n=1 Tax=Sulfitobacter brevis TaxID=74348 RepID=A0A1I2AQT9_9RHOB|nr:TerB family tellurite resistance protein [Sulfitobacter brevis]SFE46077.1 Uncharacterized conserved protein, tellurite resistance protein B (TerB) family [Sulfitobacter brevis]
MFADFIKRLTQPDPAPMHDLDARLALTALLVRIARSDNDYSATEVQRIDQIIMGRYAIDETEARKLRQDAEALESQAPDTVKFTRAIKDAVPYEERLGVIEALWKIVLVDGERAAEEDALLRLVVGLLGISDTDSAMARQRVASAG